MDSRFWYWLGVTGLATFLCAPVALSQNLQLREVWNSAGASGFEVTSIAGMAEASDGTIWVSDPRNYVVYGLNPAGTAARIMARSGDGPGEVRSPGVIATMPDGGLAIYDGGHVALELFGADGEFRHRVPLTSPIVNEKGFVVLPSEKFVMSGGIYGSDYSIHRIGLDGRREASWEPIPKTVNIRAGAMTAGGPVAVLRDGGILFSRAAPHELIEFSVDGRRERTLASDEDLLQAIGDDFIQETGSGLAMVRSFHWNFPQSGGVYQLPDGRILNVVRFFDEGATLWQLYTAEGRLVTQARVNRAYRTWTFTRSGHLLASYLDPDTDEPIAVKLQLVFR